MKLKKLMVCSAAAALALSSVMSVSAFSFADSASCLADLALCSALSALCRRFFRISLLSLDIHFVHVRHKNAMFFESFHRF